MVEFPSDEDFISMVRQDLSFLDINYNDTYIQLLSKSEFRRVLKDKINVMRHEFLIDLQSKHKKTRELVIGDEVSQYLVSNKFT